MIEPSPVTFLSSTELAQYFKGGPFLPAKFRSGEPNFQWQAPHEEIQQWEHLLMKRVADLLNAADLNCHCINTVV